MTNPPNIIPTNIFSHTVYDIHTHNLPCLYGQACGKGKQEYIMETGQFWPSYCYYFSLVQGDLA